MDWFFRFDRNRNAATNVWKKDEFDECRIEEIYC